MLYINIYIYCYIYILLYIYIYLSYIENDQLCLHRVLFSTWFNLSGVLWDLRSLPASHSWAELLHNSHDSHDSQMHRQIDRMIGLAKIPERARMARVKSTFTPDERGQSGFARGLVSPGGLPLTVLLRTCRCKSTCMPTFQGRQTLHLERLMNLHAFLFHCLSQSQNSLFCLNLFCLFPEAISRHQFLLCKPAGLLRLQASKKSSFGPHSSGQNFRDRQRDLRYPLPCCHVSSFPLKVHPYFKAFTCSSPAFWSSCLPGIQVHRREIGHEPLCRLSSGGAETTTSPFCSADVLKLCSGSRC